MKKIDIEWLLVKAEVNSQRYMEAERFLIELLNMNFVQRMFSFNKILKFLDSRINKYRF